MRKLWVGVLACFSLTRSVQFSLSKPQFPHLLNGVRWDYLPYTPVNMG